MFCAKCGQKIDSGDQFCKHCGNPVRGKGSQKGIQISMSEIYIRKIAGIIILIVALPFAAMFALSSMGISLISGLSVVIIFSIYLLCSKKYHLITDILFVLMAFAVYTINVPGFAFYNFPPVASLVTLKGFWLTADWTHSGVGADYIAMYLGLSAINLLFVSTVFFVFLTNIFSKIKPIVNSSKRNLISGLAFLAIAVIIFTLPWLHKVQVSDSTGASGAPPESGIVLSAMGPNLDNSVEFDAGKDVWTYKIELINTSQREAVIIALKAKTLDGKTVTLAPPFGANMEVISGVKMIDKIIIGVTLTPPTEPGKGPTQKPAVLKISSQQPLILIAWVEQNNKVGGQVGFWK